MSNKTKKIDLYRQCIIIVILTLLSNIYSEDCSDKIDSSIINDKRALQETTKLGCVNLKLLQRASKHGWHPQTFHSKANNKGNTITIVKTTNNVICGGYADASWRNKNGQVSTSKAFLFNQAKKARIMTGTYRQSMFDYYTQGPTFGGGHDLQINLQSNQKRGYSNLQQYKWSSVTTSSKKNTWLCGSYNFKLKEVEVFQVVGCSKIKGVSYNNLCNMNCPQTAKKGDISIDEIDTKGKKCIIHKFNNPTLGKCYLDKTKLDAYIDSKNKTQLTTTMRNGDFKICGSLGDFMDACQKKSQNTHEDVQTCSIQLHLQNVYNEFYSQGYNFKYVQHKKDEVSVKLNEVRGSTLFVTYIGEKETIKEWLKFRIKYENNENNKTIWYRNQIKKFEISFEKDKIKSIHVTNIQFKDKQTNKIINMTDSNNLRIEQKQKTAELNAKLLLEGKRVHLYATVINNGTRRLSIENTDRQLNENGFKEVEQEMTIGEVNKLPNNNIIQIILLIAIVVSILLVAIILICYKKIQVSWKLSKNEKATKVDNKNTDENNKV